MAYLVFACCMFEMLIKFALIVVTYLHIFVLAGGIQPVTVSQRSARVCSVWIGSRSFASEGDSSVAQ